VYEFLKDKILNRGYGPTVREIGNRFDIRSPNGVMCHLKALEKKGFITRESHMSRAIQLADRPARAMTVDMLGQFSANSPLSSGNECEAVDFMDVFGHGDHGCVQVRDDSCQDDGISRDDYVVIRKQDTCCDGDRVLALLEGQNALLCRFYTDPKGVRLESFAAEKKPIMTNSVSILGVVVGVVRKC
jgi:repressor LexA